MIGPPFTSPGTTSPRLIPQTLLRWDGHHAHFPDEELREGKLPVQGHRQNRDSDVGSLRPEFQLVAPSCATHPKATPEGMVPALGQDADSLVTSDLPAADPCLPDLVASEAIR